MRDQRVELKGYFLSKSTQWESWTIALNQTELGQKAARQTNTSLLIRKSYSIFVRVMVKKGVADDDDDDDE